MLKKIEKIISITDRFLYQKFGSDKSTKSLENIKEAQIIFSHLNGVEKLCNVRFVGGCLRKAISGEVIDDIDLATSLEPDEVKKILNKNGIKVIETGISHGTLTAILNKKKFEITTLRKDVSTDGRHANISFTLNWNEDSLRRDFTINAIYSDIEGRIFDPLSGILDLEKGKIQFIGSPEKRIQEDYLRILRYFRFFLIYSRVEHDKKVISSIKRNINGLNKISNERIFDELKKILKLKNINNLFIDTSSKEIILSVFPQFKFYERLKKIDNLNLSLRKAYDNELILALLIIDQSNNYEYFCHKFKTSNVTKHRFENISKHFEHLKMDSFYLEKNIKKLIYLSNKFYVKDLLLFSLCLNNKVKTIDIEKLIDYVHNCKIPKFPISGNFLKQHGYKTGKDLGKRLQLLEKQWIENNFILNKKLEEKFLENINKN